MATAEPRFVIVDPTELPWTEVLAQRHGARRASVHLQFLEWTPHRMADFARYDPGVVIERHGHASDHMVLVLEGEVTVGERVCRPRTLIVLERGAVFGPLVAGPAGALLFETWAGDPRPVPADPEGHARLLRERGIEKLAVAPYRSPRPG